MLPPGTGRTRRLNRIARVVDGTGDTGLEDLFHQLWREAASQGEIRLVVNPSDRERNGWETQQEYWVLPSMRRPEVLIPADSARLTSRALTTYRGLRRVRPRVARSAMGLAAGVGLAPSRDKLVVQRPSGRTEPPQHEPFHIFKETHQLGELRASIGIRHGANAKASLHLIRPDGDPAGLAKLSWNTLTREYVATETRVLDELDGAAGEVRTPHLLASGLIGHEQFLVASPLPLDVRQRNHPEALSLAELTGLFPIIRWDRPLSSVQLNRADQILREVSPEITSPAVDAAHHSLTVKLHAADVVIGIARRWHGDLVPWNLGRDGAGVAWLWDWESSEPDAVAGLDIIHWLLHTMPGWQGTAIADRLRSIKAQAAPLLRALGIGPSQHPVVAAAYALTIAARSAQLATEHGNWDRVRLGQDQVVGLLREGQRILDQGW